jgi:Zn-dependent protease
MISVAFALALCAGMALVLHGGMRTTIGMRWAGYDPQGMGLGLIAILAAGYFWGPLYGLSLIFAVMLHEFGHVAAYRIAGHSDARFRLIPLMGGVAISDQNPASQDQAFFIALMGPGISLAPMVLAYCAAEATYDTAPMLSDFLWAFAMVTAALNFFNLLPFWPLDGGRCVQLVTISIWPGSIRIVTLAMSAAMVAAAVWMHSLLILTFALMGTQGLFRAEALVHAQRRMTPGHALLAFGAYIFTTVTHMIGGAWLLAGFV